MERKRFALVIGSAAVLAAALACSSGSTPLAPVAGTTTFPDSLKASAPVPVSPVNGQTLVGNTFTATPAVPQYGGVTLQYRFQIFTAAGAQALDSGPVASPVWQTLDVTPNQQLAWKVRAEYQGTPGPWSSMASFQSGDPPPSFAGPIGDWQHCGTIVKDIELSQCVHDAVRPTNSVGDLEVAKRIAWLKRGDGAGLLIKASGDNIVLWQGYSLSASRICFSNGQVYKVISDAGPGGMNGADYTDNGLVDVSMFVPAIDPGKP